MLTNLTKGRLFSIILIICFWLPAASALSDGLDQDYDLNFTLPVPQALAARQYLGLPDGIELFAPEQVAADIILIEIFSMYCPICQREAAGVNRLFDLITDRNDSAPRIKVLGIGAGNSDFEVEFFKSNYQITFPMFSDPKFIIHKKVKEVGTPHFFGLRKMPDSAAQLFFSHSGPINNPEDFLNLLISKFKRETAQ